jgi:serine/threonine-protein kinase RsbW
MIAISVQPSHQEQKVLSFASTLYLRPILNLLLAEVSPLWRHDLRLGLQEALVNAACHGNRLDPQKRVVVHFTVTRHQYVWTIIDEGAGCPERKSKDCGCEDPEFEQECGRGIYMLRQIFDEVEWLPPGNHLRLCKDIRRDAAPHLA